MASSSNPLRRRTSTSKPSSKPSIPTKDVDGFHPINVAKLAMDDPTGFVPCTPLGCMRLLQEIGVETAGANVVVVGRSMIVGKPHGAPAHAARQSR